MFLKLVYYQKKSENVHAASHYKVLLMLQDKIRGKIPALITTGVLIIDYIASNVKKPHAVQLN